MKFIQHIQKMVFTRILVVMLLSSYSVLGNTNCHKNKIIQLPEIEEITISITDSETGESIPFAYFTIGINDSLVEQFMVDSNGTLTLKIKTSQGWQLKVSSLGYEPLVLENLKFSTSEPMNIQLKPISIKLDTFTLVEKKVKLIDYCRFGCRCSWVTVYPDSIPEFIDTETSKVQIMAYPNPTLGEVTITNLEDISEFYLLDISGRVLQTVQVSNTNERLELSQYATGIYIIQYLEKGKVRALKIIKE